MIDIQEINYTLKGFSKLHSIFGEIDKIKEIYTYPYKKQGIDKESYNIYGILNSSDKKWKKHFLSELEFMIIKLERIYSNEEIKKGLTNNPFSFLSELKFAVFCIDNKIKILQIEPKLNSGKKLDLLIEIDSKEVFIEVITPLMKADMIKNKCGFFPLSGETEYNLYGEFDHHDIKANNISKPFIIAIDPFYAGIDEIGVSSTIEEFHNKFPELSPFLFGIILMRKNRFNVLTSREISGYQFFRNPNSKSELEITGIFN